MNIPYETLEPGPKGATIEVVDWDETAGETHPPINLDDPRVLIRDGREPSLSDRMFHQQMVYAVCSSTYNVFRAALGRDPSWGFTSRPGTDRPVLRIRPHALREENAWYDPLSGELNFGYFDAGAIVYGRNIPSGRVYTCLSHDVIVHEMTHALLDGLRARFREATNPDVLAFHEGFADLVAIFLRFSYREVVRAAIERSPTHPESDALLLSVAMQFGQTTGSRGALRSAIDAAGCATDAKPVTYTEAGREPHRLGSVLVSAVFEAFATVFRRKTARYRRLAQYAPKDAHNTELIQLLTEEAGQLAQQFLSICIRAIDYCPPVDLRLGEYLRALITADFDLVPDDPFAYREAFIDAFARRNIYPEGILTSPKMPCCGVHQRGHLSPFRNSISGSFGSPATPVAPLTPQNCGGKRRRSGPISCDLVMLMNLAALCLARQHCAATRSIRRSFAPCDRCVASGLTRRSPSASPKVIQRRWLNQKRGPPREFLGGSTSIIGPDGKFRYVIRKSITDPRRATAQATNPENRAEWGNVVDASG